MATAGYSEKPLFEKLGMKAGMTVSTIKPPKQYFALLEGVPKSVRFPIKEQKGSDILHVFITRSSDLNLIARWKTFITKEGAIWVSWPKKTANFKTDLTEDVIRKSALSNGLVDVKVCAFDETWSCLKLVYRLTDR
jgi:hypothetical protein